MPRYIEAAISSSLRATDTEVTCEKIIWEPNFKVLKTYKDQMVSSHHRLTFQATLVFQLKDYGVLGKKEPKYVIKKNRHGETGKLVTQSEMEQLILHGLITAYPEVFEQVEKSIEAGITGSNLKAALTINGHSEDMCRYVERWIKERK